MNRATSEITIRYELRAVAALSLVLRSHGLRGRLARDSREPEAMMAEFRAALRSPWRRALDDHAGRPPVPHARRTSTTSGARPTGSAATCPRRTCTAGCTWSSGRAPARSCATSRSSIAASRNMFDARYVDIQNHLTIPPRLDAVHPRQRGHLQGDTAPREYRLDYVGVHDTEIHLDLMGIHEPYDIHDPNDRPDGPGQHRRRRCEHSGFGSAYANHFDLTMRGDRHGQGARHRVPGELPGHATTTAGALAPSAG